MLSPKSGIQQNTYLISFSSHTAVRSNYNFIGPDVTGLKRVPILIYVAYGILQAMYYKKYSVFSDVWSYGCVLYEIWSLGRKPFEEMTNDVVCMQLFISTCIFS